MPFRVKEFTAGWTDFLEFLVAAWADLVVGLYRCSADAADVLLFCENILVVLFLYSPEVCICFIQFHFFNGIGWPTGKINEPWYDKQGCDAP